MIYRLPRKHYYSPNSIALCKTCNGKPSIPETPDGNGRFDIKCQNCDQKCKGEKALDSAIEFWNDQQKCEGRLHSNWLDTEFCPKCGHRSLNPSQAKVSICDMALNGTQMLRKVVYEWIEQCLAISASCQASDNEGFTEASWAQLRELSPSIAEADFSNTSGTLMYISANDQWECENFKLIG